MTKITVARAVEVLGPSGRGKSTSIENLDHSITAIVNWESQRLPFKNADKFTQFFPTSTEKGYKVMDKLLESNVQIVVQESLSAFLELALNECRTIYDGWDVWSMYNKHIFRFFEYQKKFTKQNVTVFCIAHDELVEDIDSIAQKRTKVKGNEWKGLVEKEFDMVLYSKVVIGDDGKPQYLFQTNSDGKTPAKTPKGMFEEFQIANDLNLVYQAIKKYDA